ncbi:MAG: rhodanese [Pirellulaceae bacterium]|nr:rhodanese [Pirellulaceae bacterium]
MSLFSPSGKMPELSVNEVEQKLKEKEPFLFLDCREVSEHEVANIEGATLLPMQEISSRVAEIESWREKLVIVFCHHGRRSLKVADWLHKNGFSDVYSMKGGIDCWSTEIDNAVPRY